MTKLADPTQNLCPMVLAFDTISDIPRHERSASEQRELTWGFSASEADFLAIFDQQRDL